MSDVKFTDLPTVPSASLADVICAIQSNVSSQETLQQVFNLMLANMVLNYSGNPNGHVAGSIYQLCWDTTNTDLYICTTTGTSTTAVWTLVTSGGLTIPIPLADGGTNAALVADNGAIVFSTASALALLAATNIANRIVMSQSNAAPIWSTATYPATIAINRLLYASDVNVISGLATINSGALVTNATGIPTWLGSLSNGQIVIGSTGAIPVAATLTAGPGISISNAAGSITISGTGSGIGWTEITAATQLMVADNGYVANRATLITFTLPATAAFGTAISLIGKGAGGWAIAQNAGQNIQVGSVSSTVGVGGSLASTNRFDSIDLICTTADTTWTVLGGVQGTITIV